MCLMQWLSTYSTGSALQAQQTELYCNCEHKLEIFEDQEKQGILYMVPKKSFEIQEQTVKAAKKEVK